MYAGSTFLNKIDRLLCLEKLPFYWSLHNAMLLLVHLLEAKGIFCQKIVEIFILYVTLTLRSVSWLVYFWRRKL